ncbi:MAG TPA: hypothetical protein VGO59_00165 [Verrucomicrobiae bacterium]|jgi:hypothetical protein
MKMTKSVVIIFAICLLSRFSAMGQAYVAYKFIFNGTAYQTNGAGVIVATPITDQTLLQSQAQRLGITNLSTISLVYHVNGGPPYGDTVDVISNANSQTLTTEFGLYFGSAYIGQNSSLGRYAVTNLAQTEQRRVDQVYTFSNTPYTYANSESLGGAFTCKRFLGDSNGNTNALIDGTLFWDALPTQGNAGPLLCTGRFTLGQPVF